MDVQRMFLEDTPWHVRWMERVLPQIETVAARHSDRTIFTRFIPPPRAEDALGAWRSYYKKWSQMTREALPAELLDMPPTLRRFVPPARIFDKAVYSPWIDGSLCRAFRREAVDTVVITGGETDVCVLATVLGAIDLGFYVILLTDAVCSGADETHDKTVDVLADRFSAQLTLVETDHFLSIVS